MNGWKEYRIGEIGTTLTGKTPSGQIKGSYGHEIPFVTPTDFKNYIKHINTADRYLSKLGVENLKNKVLPKNSIVVTCIGSDMGKVAMNKVPCITNQQINSIIPKVSIVNPDFLYYKLVSEYSTLKNLATGGSTMPILNKGVFDNIGLFLPPLSIQNKIAEVLGALDDKIELNRQINQTLEDMARTLFNRNFIEGIETNHLPKDWRSGSVLDLAYLLSGGTPKTEVKEFWNGEYKWISAKDVTANDRGFITDTEKKISYLGLNNSAAKLLPKYTTVITARGTVGKYCILSEEMAISQSNYGLRSKTGSVDFYIFLLVENMIDMMHQYSYGTVFDTITTKTFNEIEINIPPQPMLDEFEKLITPIFENRLSITKESIILAETRDTLLPKLISGELIPADLEAIEQTL